METHKADWENRLILFLRFLREVEKEMARVSEKQVMIEKAINLRLMCDYVVSCSYGDIVLIIYMLREYIRMLDEIKVDDIWYQSYYRDKFAKMADRLAEQIGYDYDKAVEKCQKKRQKDDNSDVGEDKDGLTQLVRKKIKEEQREGDGNEDCDQHKRLGSGQEEGNR